LEFIAQIPTNLGAHDCQFHANLPQFSLSSGPIDIFILSCLLQWFLAQFNNQTSLSCSRPVNHLGFNRLIIHNYTIKHSKCRIATVRFPSSNNVVSFPWEILWNIFYVSFHEDTILSRKKQQQQHLNKPIEEPFKLKRRHLRSKRHNMLEMNLPANIWLSPAHYEMDQQKQIL